VGTSLPIHVLAQLGEMRRLPRNGFGVDETRQVVIEPADDPVQAGCDKLRRTTNGVDQDQDLGGFFLSIALQHLCFPPVCPKLFCCSPEALRTPKDDG